VVNEITRIPDRRPPEALTHLELLQDLAGYVFGFEKLGYRPGDWDADVARWLDTPRGRETLARMALPAREPDAGATEAVLVDVALERLRQEQIGAAKRATGIDWRSCADPAMAGGDGTRYLVLGEEVGEVANAVLEATYGSIDAGDAHLREELVQVAAVATAWAEAIDARANS
jgi:hypothetical protein